MRPLLRRSRFEEKRKKEKSNFNSLTLPPKELEAQEMRPLLRRPRFEEKKKENKIQHHFHDCAAKKKPNASDVPALPPAALRKELSKKQVAAAPHFCFRVVVVAWLNMLNDEMPVISSHFVGKDQRNFGTTNKNKYRVHAVNPLEKKWGFCRTAC